MIHRILMDNEPFHHTKLKRSRTHAIPDMNIDNLLQNNFPQKEFQIELNDPLSYFAQDLPIPSATGGRRDNSNHVNE